MNDGMTMQPEEIRLEIPGAAEFLRLARLAVADLGARAGLRDEDIDDLRIAVDVLCYAIGAGDEAARIVLLYRVAERRLEVEGRCERVTVVSPPSELANAIIAAVVDKFDLMAECGVCSFRFVKWRQCVTERSSELRSG